MSNHVSYQGRDLGRLKIDELHKFIFVANGLESLEALLSLNPTDELEVEGRDNMTYEKFRKEYLEDIDAFYPSVEAWACKATKGHSKDLIKKR